MTEPYKSAAAVEAAIRDAARNAFVADKSMSTQDRIRQEYFRRFLSRIFSERDDSDWLLKGGTGVLARVASGRRTTDVDHFRANNTLDGALKELTRLASLDLGDFFRFVYTKHQSAVAGDQQTHTEGYGVDFDVYIGADKKEPLHVDLVVGAIITDEVRITPPANRVDLPRLPSNDYRLDPIVDQIADKVCATMADYSGRPSSREKDLVDLVIIAKTQTRERRLAEARHRRRGPCSLGHPIHRTDHPTNLGTSVREGGEGCAVLLRLPDGRPRGRTNEHLHQHGLARRGLRQELDPGFARLELTAGDLPDPGPFLGHFRAISGPETNCDQLRPIREIPDQKDVAHIYTV